MGPEVMYPLYPSFGGIPRGYTCNQPSTEERHICRTVTRTQKGMWAHLRIVHGIRKQAKLDFEKRESAA